MSEPHIYLVRHGEAAASWGQSADPGLSELGQQQAAATAGELLTLLAGQGEPRIVSSPLLRAQETAAAFARQLAEPVQVEIDPRFREIPSPVPLAERQNWLRSFMRGAWSAQSEDLHAWRAALIAGARDAVAPTVVFSHFLVINTLVGAVEQSDDTLVFWPDNASITTLGLRDGNLTCLVRGREMQTRVN